MREPCRHEAAHFYRGEKHDMKQGEEHREIALGRHPQLYVRHTFEGALYLRHAAHHAHGPQDGQRQAQHRHGVARHYHRCRRHEQGAVGEAELHAEEHGEVECHARKRGIEAHLHILAHNSPLAHHVVHGSQIHTVGELEAEGEHHIYPRAHALRHKVVVHGHGEGHGRPSGRFLLSFVIHNILSFPALPFICLPASLRTPHSFLREASPCFCLPKGVCAPECAAPPSRNCRWHCPAARATSPLP